jgi:hypothetical protein
MCWEYGLELEYISGVEYWTGVGAGVGVLEKGLELGGRVVLCYCWWGTGVRMWAGVDAEFGTGVEWGLKFVLVLDLGLAFTLVLKEMEIVELQYRMEFVLMLE